MKAAKVGDTVELLIPADRAYGPEMEGAFAVLPRPNSWMRRAWTTP